jgi:hypothetical protein
VDNIKEANMIRRHANSITLILLSLFAGIIFLFTPKARDVTARAVVPQGRSAGLAAVGTAFTYQGRLVDSSNPANGTFDFRFILYDTEVGGAQVGPTLTKDDLVVTDGLFTVLLDFGDVFGASALWLEIAVRPGSSTGSYTTLSPRQELTSTPFASSVVAPLSLQADIPPGGDLASSAVLAAVNTRTGSEDTFGIYAEANSYYATLQVHSAAILGKGGPTTNAQGVRGEAGDVTGSSRPIGPVGVVGIGQNRGVFGSSSGGSGVYGISDDNYGMWGQSDTYRGVTGRTNRADNNYGLYTPDNLYSLNYNLAGAIMMVAQNGGREPLEAGDVAVFYGIGAPLAEGGPAVVQVAKTNMANNTAVAGVVYSRFNIAAIAESQEHPDDKGSLAPLEVTPAGPTHPGDYLLLVIQGPARVKASTLGGTIVVGDLLATGQDAGFAWRAKEVSIGEFNAPFPGAVFGKALEPLTVGQEEIYVFVTLH